MLAPTTDASVPAGSEDTATPVSAAPTDPAGTDASVVGAGAGGVLLAGGAVLFVVRRRRAATGA